MHLVSRGALVSAVDYQLMLICYQSEKVFSLLMSDPEIFLKFIIRMSEILILIVVMLLFGTERNIVPFTNDSHCQIDSISEHKGGKKLPPFLKPLSILFSLSCCTAPQYSLKSFRGTSEVFVKCICIWPVISWKMSSLFHSFLFVAGTKHVWACKGIQYI